MINARSLEAVHTELANKKTNDKKLVNVSYLNINKKESKTRIGYNA